MDMQHRAAFVRRLVERPEALVGEGDPLTLLKSIAPGRLEVVHGAPELLHGRLGSLSGSVAIAANRGASFGDDLRERIVDQSGQASGRGR